MRSKGVDGYGRKKKRCYVTDKAKSVRRDQVPGCGEVDEDRGAGQRRPEHLPLGALPRDRSWRWWVPIPASGRESKGRLGTLPRGCCPRTLRYCEETDLKS